MDTNLTFIRLPFRHLKTNSFFHSIKTYLFKYGIHYDGNIYRRMIVMLAPKEIVDMWKKFDDKPMDTLMKLWWSKQIGGGGQRSVLLIKEHFEQYGVAGNCVDLSLWLIKELRDAGIEAYGITDDVHAERAHIAVVAIDKRGHRYLCDLGDQWIQPINLDSDDRNKEEWFEGFFPAAKVMLETEGNKTSIIYQRSNGKTSRSVYDTTPLDNGLLWEISERVQTVCRKQPLVEVLLPLEGEVVHWEFDAWKSFLSTSQELVKEDSNLDLSEGVDRIHFRTGMDKGFLLEALRFYMEMVEE